MMLQPFPWPTAPIRQALDALAYLAPSEDGRASDMAAPILERARPWSPSSCHGSLRRALWQWLDEVIEWINLEHVRQPEQVIPACWPQHPDIVHEIAPLAVLRWQAELDQSPMLLADWHRIVLPDFLARQSELRNSCEPGRHRDSAAASRSRAYRSDEAAGQRLQRFVDDLASET